MMGLFGTLNLGARALQTQSQGMAVAGQNLANVNNTAYSRQRLIVQTTGTIPSAIGSQGTGVSAVAIQRIHDSLLDRQIQGETGVSGFWTAQQNALLSAQTNLGEAINSSAQGADGTTTTGAVGAQSTLASDLAGLFSEFQNLAATPTSLSQRGVLLSKAQNLASQFNQADSRLAEVNDNLNESVTDGVGQCSFHVISLWSGEFNHPSLNINWNFNEYWAWSINTIMKYYRFERIKTNRLIYQHRLNCNRLDDGYTINFLYTTLP